jgi:hypothetical protein
MADPPTPPDLAIYARDALRWILTVAAAVAFAVLVYKLSKEVWDAAEKQPPTIGKVRAAVTISLSVTFGSAFVGWFGVTSTTARAALRSADLRGYTRWLLKVLLTPAGAALLAMFVYLGAGAWAGYTYLANEDESPTVLITVATAWAAQASAVIASTLAVSLRGP